MGSKIIEKDDEEFKEGLEAFFSSQERIFDLLNRLTTDYLRGKAVKKELKRFRGINKPVYDLIQDLFTNEEEIHNKLEKIDISKDRKESLLSIKDRFSELTDPISSIFLEELLEVENPITSMYYNFRYRSKRKAPIIENTAYSGGERVFYLKLTLSGIAGIANRLQELIKMWLEEMDEEIVNHELETIETLARDSKDITEKILKKVEDRKEKREEND